MNPSEENIQQVVKENKALRQENQDLKQKLDAISSKQTESNTRILKASIKGVGIWAGADLKNSFNVVFEELPNVSKKSVAQLSASIAKRITRIGLFTILFAVIPALVLFVQTSILFQQNEKLEEQNKKIQNQIYLEEASRRNNLVFLMDNVLDIIHEELYESPRLTASTIARTKSLMYGFRPYKFLEGEKLTKPLSPEKGQFLLALIHSDISKSSMQKIFTASFNNVYLKDANMFGVSLENIDMPSSDLQGVDLWQANLKNANLNNTNLTYAKLGNTNLTHADLRFAQLNHANLTNAILDDAFLDNTTIQNANLTGTSLQNVHVTSENWIKNLKEWNVIGADAISNTYTIKGPRKNEFDDEYFVLERIKK
ncbi:pentapeptide repeat-containing protein [uncultured Dokdonia sp.]|uniref:pentapeptide repeat-containing protein n=1 Tax=uncultured Dokdonia sp. TaxID=575653 RepID=UPI002618740E|nr:pentapeptide repeat-containing protein [uncultured Dokdonia sp.]